MGFGLSKYIETGTAGQHQSGGPCCGDYCPLWEVGGGAEDDDEEEEVEEVGLLEMRRRNKNNIISQTLVGFSDLPDPHRPATPMCNHSTCSLLAGLKLKDANGVCEQAKEGCPMSKYVRFVKHSIDHSWVGFKEGVLECTRDTMDRVGR